MRFSQALTGMSPVAVAAADAKIKGVTYDSRHVRKGWAFVAMHGGTSDGNAYIDAALKQGASAILTDSAESFARLRRMHPYTAAAQVADGRKALALFAAALYGHPERKLALHGITGTNGKTTTSFVLESILHAMGRECALVGTIEYHVPGQVIASPHTTPESSDLLALFARAVDAGASDAVMEVSSHALAQARVWGMSFATAIFTNLTQDHLDFHGTMEKYFAAKRRLFVAGGTGGDAPKVAVLNAEDERSSVIAKDVAGSATRLVTYGMLEGDVRAEDVELMLNGARFRLQTPSGTVAIESKLTGRVNILNLLAAAAAAEANGATLEQIADGIEQLACVPGRFQQVVQGQPFAVVVDYAHTSDALRNLLQLARELVRGKGRVITVFGCGGDRDRGKRPLMGRAAGEGSDVVVVTSDNPRSEDPLAIMEDIRPGVAATPAKSRFIAERAEAIRTAIAQAREGDIVLIAGKGHEKTQTTRTATVPFDDVEVAREALMAGASR
jgi:UDP-N-acetylmuramoyl-L-alanyl-D-glutamate--2,6-diaminopimelate ligase